jgi:hypothetical protein
MKQQVDQHHSERSFEVGDWVFLRLQPHKQMSFMRTPSFPCFMLKEGYRRQYPSSNYIART